MPELSPTLARNEWVNAFAFEWNRLAEGRCDIEEMLGVGSTLYRVVGDQAPEAIADRHFKSFPEPEDRVRDPAGEYAALAAELGIIRPGDKLDEMLMEFAYAVAAKCAAIGDHYGDPSDGNAGDHIRALYGPV